MSNSKHSSVLNDKLTSLKRKVVTIEVKDVPIPPPHTSVLDTYRTNSTARQDIVDRWTIDLFPNMIPVIIYIMLTASDQADLLDLKTHGKLSVPTFIMYHVCILYGYFLLNDAFLRPDPSAHAKDWKQKNDKLEFLHFLLTLPVPESLEIILNQYVATEPDRSHNLHFIPSAAGFNYQKYFGRFIPINFFSAIHNCTAELPGNSSRMQIYSSFFNTVLHSVKKSEASRSADYNCYTASLLGIIQETGTHDNLQHHNSRLFQTFTTIFNPVLFRDYQKRKSLATIAMTSPRFDTNLPNAYDVLFAYTSNNLRELRGVLQALASLLPGNIHVKNNLGTFLTNSSGVSALEHGYSTFPLPTWSSNKDKKFEKVYNELQLITEADFASKISFLQKKDLIPQTAIPTPVVTDSTGKDVTKHVNVKNYDYPFSLVRPVEKDKTFPLMDRDFVLFNEDENVVPHVYVLDVPGNGNASSYLATLSGKIIETFELAASTVEHPSDIVPLGIQNSRFADSAIPFQHTLDSFEFYVRNAGEIPPPMKRANPLRSSRLPASSLLINRTELILPAFEPNVVDNAIPAYVPGFIGVFNYTWISRAQRFLGFHTVDAMNHEDKDDQIPGLKDRKLYVWSPYTYTPYEDPDGSRNLPSHSKSYFLTNLRTLYGTETKLTEVAHPYEALPYR